jgi:glycosyltransferase involved in cell wall biosynthesis
VVTPDAHRSRIYLEEFRARRPPLTVRNCPPYRPPIASTRLRDDLARRGIAPSLVVLYQGLVDTGRCIEEIAEATRRFDAGVFLVIIGDGFGKWANAATALAGYDRIVVLPRVPYEELPAYTASADVGLLLYRNDCRNNYFCAPNKVFEYMMMGLPVVATDFPGMRTLVEGEAIGLCVDPRDPAHIAAAVNRLAADPAARRHMKANGLRLSLERYHWQEEFRPLLERYVALTAGGPEAG